MKRIALTYSLLSPYLFMVLYLIISYITPDYNQLRHTISRLSIGKYGYLESLNIIQFSFGLFMMIYFIRRTVQNSETLKQISLMLSGIAMTLVLLAIVPTDPIDSFPKQLLSISPTALMHFSIVGLFILCTPLRVFPLYTAFKQDGTYKDLAPITLLCGLATFFLSILWFIFFYIGFLNDIRGLFQKCIAIIVLYWVARIMHRTAYIMVTDTRL